MAQWLREHNVPPDEQNLVPNTQAKGGKITCNPAPPPGDLRPLTLAGTCAHAHTPAHKYICAHN